MEIHMFPTRQFLLAALIVALSASSFAQTHRAPVLAATASSTAVRYTGFGEVREMRLEVFNEDAQVIFDSDVRRGNLIEYTLTDREGNRIADGMYLFVVTIRDFDEAVSQKFGIVRLADRRVMLENAAADSVSPAQMEALRLSRRGPSMTPVDRIGADIPADAVAVVAPGAVADKPASPVTAIPRSDVAGTGTVNRVTKWTDAVGTLGDSAITEVGGKVGIGTQTPGSQLHLFGTANLDVFAGMGVNVTTGPAMNFGYAGASFGRGAGFFNMRPAPGAVPPNPSLRFMTDNVQHMIITNTGEIGIGTLAPSDKLTVNGAISSSGTIFGSFLASNSSVNAAEDYRIQNQKVLRVTGSSNVFVGVDAGNANDPGFGNTFVGKQAGLMNIDGVSNTFVGVGAGQANVSSNSNSYFGSGAGGAKTGGVQNTMIGASAGGNIEAGTGAHGTFVGYQAGAGAGGDFNTYVGELAGASLAGGGGFFNTAVGAGAGQGLTTASSNVLIGQDAGKNLGAGGSNTIVGTGAGENMTGVSSNTVVGSAAGLTISNGLNVAVGASATAAAGVARGTAIGTDAIVTQANSLVLGSINGKNGATTDTTVGIGTTAPRKSLEVAIGDVFVSAAGKGILLKSPTTNLCRLLTIDDLGAVVLLDQGACPAPPP
jgi:hypothetical protein